MVQKFEVFQIIIISCLVAQIFSDDTIIKAKNLESYCEKNLFRFVIEIEISNQLNDYKSFYLKTNDDYDLLFKCIIDPKKNIISCITNLEQQKRFLETDDIITLPYPFPTLSGIVWDYDSFLGLIYRRVIYMKEECGSKVTRLDFSKVNAKKWDFVFKINKIYNGQCLMSDTADNLYTFTMNADILGGNIKDSLDSSATAKTKTEIKLMQNITMPFVLGPMESIIQELNIFQSHKYYKIASCYPLEDINVDNYKNENGIDFKCNIPINDQYIFNGPLKIVTYTDNIYAKVKTPDNGEKIDYISLYFTTQKNATINTNPEELEEEEKIDENDSDEDEDEFLSENESDEENNEETIPNSEPSSPIPSAAPSPSSSSTQAPPSVSSEISKASPSPSPSPSSPNPSANLRGLLDTLLKQKKPYLLLDDRRTNFICPNVPVFEIENIKDGIVYKPIPDEEDKFNVILSGYLKNGYKVLEKKIIPLKYSTNDIDFNISVINNLAKDISDKKNDMSCKLESGASFTGEEITEIKCLGKKSQQADDQNTDLSINWATKENKYLNNILIRWPKDLTIHSKKIYSYAIYAISIRKTDFDCYEDKFYFYVNILDLHSEPQISFQINMLKPENVKADCKLYSSNLLKCIIDLRLKKIKKGTNIRLPLPGNYNISTSEGNYINFTVFNFKDENNTDIADEGIIVDETCGNNVLVGAIQDIGYNYTSTIIIIICIFVIFGVIILFITICVAYEITHRNKKGKYFAHVEENNKSVNNTTMAAIANQQNIVGGLPKK